MPLSIRFRDILSTDTGCRAEFLLLAWAENRDGGYPFDISLLPRAHDDQMPLELMSNSDMKGIKGWPYRVLK